MKLLNIWSLEALIGRYIGEVIAYLVSRDATWKEYIMKEVEHFKKMTQNISDWKFVSWKFVR